MTRTLSCLFLISSAILLAVMCSVAQNSEDEQWDPVVFDLALAEKRFLQGQTNNAERILRKRVELTPEDERAVYALADFYDRQRMYALCVQVIDQASRNKKPTPKLAVTRAEALMKLGLFEQAVSAYESLGGTNEVASVSNWALCYYKSGRFAQAQQLWKRVHAERPDDEWIVYSLGLASAEAGDALTSQRMVEKLRSTNERMARDLVAHLELIRAGSSIGDRSPKNKRGVPR